ncbi:MAG: DUF1573 domain-containing protein [Taibaiella sp.]|nr:DUF1573 domain-containing protein [Taibaiella sp.]
MKRYLIILTMALSACGNSKQADSAGNMPASIVNNPLSASGIDSAAAATKPVMTFTDTLHNFGNIKEGEVVSCEFSFANIGKSPLIISSAAGSCGCTVADYPHDPILPGQAATMKVTFNSAGKPGHQEKAITLQTNTVKNIHMLYIQAEVNKKQ